MVTNGWFTHIINMTGGTKTYLRLHSNAEKLQRFLVIVQNQQIFIFWWFGIAFNGNGNTYYSYCFAEKNWL